MFLDRTMVLTCLFALTASLPSHAAPQGKVTWSDPTCGYFALALPAPEDPKDAFGLFSVKAPPVPEVGDVLEGDVIAAQEPELLNTSRNVAHATIHWANAARLEMLVRNTPVQCASRWKRKH
jgi:hypothetical protein